MRRRGQLGRLDGGGGVAVEASEGRFPGKGNGQCKDAKVETALPKMSQRASVAGRVVGHERGAPMLQGYGSPLGAILPLGDLAMSRDIFCCHSRELATRI